MKKEILKTIEGFDKIIISPDMDGFISAHFVNRFNGAKVVGTYDSNKLCLSDGVKIEECLFLDCDINRPDIVSLGNHMRLINDNMSKRSFNPNIHFGVTNYKDKYPFATAYLLAFALEIETSAQDIIRMAYADSTLRNMISYSDNMRNWSDKMPHPSVKYVIYNTEYSKSLDDEMRLEYGNDQSFTSWRFGKERYIKTINEALVKENVPHETLITGIKYIKDKVGYNTVNRYMNDIFSYAETYQGEYSVTYMEETEWK